MKSKLTFGQAFMAGLTAAVIAAVINVILFYVFHAAGIFVDTIFLQPGMPLTIVPILISSILPTLVATVVFYLLERFTSNGFKIFRIIAIVLLLVSFLNPFMGIPGVTVGYAVALNVMHIVVVALLLYFLGKKVSAKE